VTDANLQLGRLHPDNFGAKDITLSPEKTAVAIRTAIGEPLGMDDNTAAVGIAEVVDENMTNAARVHAVENGKDLAGFSMIAFGGGAPLHASRLMDKLGLDELFIPTGAGVGSAIGFLRAPFAYEAVRSLYTQIEDFDFDAVNQVLADLTNEAETFVRQGTDASRRPERPGPEAQEREKEPGGAGTPDEPRLIVERQVSMRYKGQGWEIPVKLPDGEFDAFAAEGLGATFTKAYEEFFGRAIDDLTIETVSWAVRVASVLELPDALELTAETNRIAAANIRPIFDPTAGEVVDSVIVERDELSPGDAVAGPGVIVEQQTTTVLASHHVAVMQTDGTLLVTRGSTSKGAVL
jgi:N-methylhydantoinase A